MNEKIGIILVSYGSASKAGREKSLNRFEEMVRETFQGYWIRSAFTSNYMIEKVREREEIDILSFQEAMKCAKEDGVENLIVQQVHLLNGYIGSKEIDELEKYKDQFNKIEVGKPLLASEKDIEKVASIIVEDGKKYIDEKTAVCFVGHGTESDSNTDYTLIQDAIRMLGSEQYFIGVLHGKPSAENIISQIKKKQYDRIVLIPLMLTTGYHVNKNIAGIDKDSWKSQFEAEGYRVECVMRGLGENEQIRNIFLMHTFEAMRNMNKR